MRILKNKIVASVLAFAVASSSIAVCISNASSYTSTLDIAYNSWMAGADRSFDSANYHIKIRPKTLYSGKTSVDVDVCSKTTIFGVVWDYNELCGDTVDLEKTGTTYSKSLGNASSGTRCYIFSTSGNRGGFNADYVQMSST